MKLCPRGVFGAPIKAIFSLNLSGLIDSIPGATKSVAKHTSYLEMRDSILNELKEVQGQLSEEKYDRSINLFAIKMNRHVVRNGMIPNEHVIDLLEKEADLETTLKRLNFLLAKNRNIVSESQSDGPIATDEVKVMENLTDVMGDTVEIRHAGSTIVPQIGQQNLLSLDDFFSRPISIDSFTVAVGSAMTYSWKIWDAWSLEPTIRAKLRNYTYFKGDLVVRFTFSGSPMHFGKALISYQPFAGINENLKYLLQAYGFESGFRKLIINYLSQAPGACTIDYRHNKPIDIRCPFMSPKPMHRLFNSASTVLSGATSYTDFADAGTIFLYSIDSVKAIGTTSSPLGVHVYCWAENVELGPPTATQIDIVTESSSDERVTGPIERMATFMSTVSNALSAVPGIGPLAKASSAIFSGVAGVSAWFGWSRPNVLDKPSFVKNRPYSSTSSTIGYDTVEKICFDPLQEVTIDPRVCGTQEDELSLAYLNSIPTYLDTFDWNHNSAIMTLPIWRMAIHPQMATWTYSTFFTKYFYQPTAMMFAATPFARWRGSISVRLEIACSEFHRGKIAVMYEPNIAQGALIDSSIALNKNYMKIIDIQETQDVEFCIEYAQPYMWLSTVPSLFEDFYGSSFTYTQPANTVNGYISVTPFTALQSPDDSDISVHVYVKGDELQYNLLCSTNLPLTRQIVSESSSDRGVEPEVAYTCLTLNATSSTNKGTSEYCFGEQPLSFRSYLKRYMTSETGSGAIGAGAHASVSWVRPIIDAPVPAYSASPVAPTALTILGYLRYAYLGIKGGMRTRWRLTTDAGSFKPTQAVVVSLRTEENNPTTSGPTTGSNNSKLAPIGSATFIPTTNSGVEVELPFYSSNLFHFSFNDGLDGGYVSGQMINYWIRNYTVTMDNTDVSTTVRWCVDTACAEDFMLMRFMGAPYFSQ